MFLTKRTLFRTVVAAMTLAAITFVTPTASADVQAAKTSTDDGISAQSFGAMHQPTTGVVTSRFKDRCPNPDLDHYGIDIANDAGTRIGAAYRGKVSFAGWQNGYGNVIYIRHRAGYETRYAHLSRIRVKVGQQVSRHQLIGHMGATGNVTGVHLHFEVRRSGKPVNLNDAYRCNQTVRAFQRIKHNFSGLPR